MQLAQGTLLERGKYRILETLGRGGFGVTYLAEQVMAKRKVCIKEFFPKDYYKRDGDSGCLTLSSDGFAEMMGKFKVKFVKEAQTIAALDHPNIIPIHDVFEENGTAYYVMDYVDGESLSDKVKRSGALSEADAVAYIRQVAEALDYIHAQQIMHLDVKPGNVMVRSKDNRALLIDFGLSKHYDTNSGEATSTTPVGVSHGYAPIEQYQQGGVGLFSPETDIYSLGATLYYLVTGKTPPQAAIVGEQGVGLGDGVSPNVRNAIEHAMQYWRKDRPRTIKEFMALLAPGVGAVPKKTTSPKRNPEQPQRNKKSRWWLWLVMVAILAGAAAYIFMFGDATPKDKVATTEAVEVDPAEKMRQDSIARAEREQMRLDSIARAEREQIRQDSINSANEASERRRKQADDDARARASLKLAKSSQTVSYEAGSYELSFTLQSPYDGLRVTAEDNQSWITIDDIGAKELYYSVAENNTTSNRSGVITLMYNDKSYKFTVTQGYFNVSELYNQGVAYYNQKNYTEAVKYFSQAAEQGHASAQNDLGVCYDAGYGVPEDDSKAVEWYRKAAEQGYAEAQNSLGLCYYNGDGVTKDYTKAVEWFRKAAEQGNARAQYNLGLCYRNGYGVPKDDSKAVEWDRKAAEQGNAWAQYNLGVCYYNGDGVTKDYTKAVEWCRKAAEQGLADAQYNLGYCYANGYGVPQNYTIAVEWLRKAAEQGFADAQNYLGVCYLCGHGVTKDYTKAVEWYRKAARQGNTTAQKNLRDLGESW